MRDHGSRSTIASLAVVDVDPALVAFLERELAGAPFPVRCVEHDLRRPLPPELAGAFDTVVTDPPYTTAGASSSRAAESLAGAATSSSRSDHDARRRRAAAAAIAEIGFVIQNLSRDFNEYVGAGVLGGTSHLYHLAATGELAPPSGSSTALHGGLDLALVRVRRYASSARTPIRAEEAAPRLLLVPDGAELPDAERGPVRPLERPGWKPEASPSFAQTVSQSSLSLRHVETRRK